VTAALHPLNAGATAEGRRLDEERRRVKRWNRWGPYLADRAWGTVREDYSRDATPWEYFPHDHARSRAYRWNEDGLAGLCDRHQHICLALALWNGRDPFLKERLFGVTNHEGNHGEDVKECYFYLDNTPTHSYMKCLYKYPQAAFPYAELVAENRRRGRDEPEYELLDTGVFDGDKYFDVQVEYAKADVEDILIRIVVTNRGADPAHLDVLPTIWFRNTWTWSPGSPKPQMRQEESAVPTVALDHPAYGRRWLRCDGRPAVIFTENETNRERLFDSPNASPYVKDAFHRAVVDRDSGAANPARVGTKAAAWYAVDLAPGETTEIRLTFTDAAEATPSEFADAFTTTFDTRIREADELYARLFPSTLSADARNVARQAVAGLLWSKQCYHYVVQEWLDGDPGQPPPPPERLHGRNAKWTHVYNEDVLAVPDKWEYPWYASWDLAFHTVALALVDADFAKQQLVLLLREWYMHPNGQLPAYEWAFDDVNPPVHAWAAWRIYKIDQKRRGQGDRVFLERVFLKLLLNFTWWVNREDADGRNVFEGGFLGLDNIGLFDRSQPLPSGVRLEQSDATSWMAMYTLNMLAIAVELARDEPAYEDVASKFWEHFVYIAHAMTGAAPPGGEGHNLWDEEDGFFYDVLAFSSGQRLPVKIRSMVGLLPLLAVETIEPSMLKKLPGFAGRLEWFAAHRPDLTANVASIQTLGMGGRRLLAAADRQRLQRVLKVMLDEREFLSPYGIRSMSRVHAEHPYTLWVNGAEHQVSYDPAESRSLAFGGNSNWRGPIWFPVNYLLIEALQRFHHYYGNDFKVECPTGSGRLLTLWEVAAELSRRLTRLFLKRPDGTRPVYGINERAQRSPHWSDLLLFHEYFHGDTGVGLGASHQTGWTALVAKLLQQTGSS
jgi:mannosylglycerate hydrolase MGH1-like protein